jgi:ParB family chromosome partitioning protein
MAEKRDRRGLGRGLSALMADVSVDPAASSATALRKGETTVPIERIFPNPDQPRRQFTEQALNDLTASIREKGVIQPLIVRPMPGDPTVYQIVAGERRWRAAQAAQLHELPVIVRDFDDTEVLEVAIIENIQRADLNPMEEAAGYRQLMDKFGHTQEKLALALGKSRSHIANCLRLLTLPAQSQEALNAGQITAGHARALLTADNPAELLRLIIANSLSVRDAEKLAKGKRPSEPKSAKLKARVEKDADTVALEHDLVANLGMGVSIDHAPGGEVGSITISYKSLDQLDELCRLLTAMPPVVTR